MLFAPVAINLLGFNVNVIDQGSNVVIGPNQQFDLFVSTKRNQGFGELNGDLSPVNIPIQAVNDTDIIDSASVKNSVI
ncbi:hypothetical protein [Neobacillus sp. PS3-40]|jgi:hypothetical protein|uniref:hypothetical protein n=1 Tax=Neobacillus sp. PS3-40 TaxID=3070679 RepID=UPI0027E0F47F|nr:hypothetical protein [Neobacillus sp. PS3-40]WML44933.1 hypothetical protein RCG20_03230 [Neobacillus sp. PS3-40]